MPHRQIVFSRDAVDAVDEFTSQLNLLLRQFAQEEALQSGQNLVTRRSVESARERIADFIKRPADKQVKPHKSNFLEPPDEHSNDELDSRLEWPDSSEKDTVKTDRHSKMEAVSAR